MMVIWEVMVTLYKAEMLYEKMVKWDVMVIHEKMVMWDMMVVHDL